ncbi:MAG: hypothetical protein Q9195_006241 [Heterodermia aff. obscurata]
MVARTPQNGYSHHQANGRSQDESYGTPAVGRANGVGNNKYLHLKDLQAKAEMEAKDLGAHTPIRTLLNRAQQAATQANSMVDFQHIDRAYVQYMISCDILLNLIPHHRDFPSVSNGSREWHRSYISICKVSTLDHLFSSMYFMDKVHEQLVFSKMTHEFGLYVH